MARRPPKTDLERLNISRADIELEAEVQSDPVEVVRRQLTKMWVQETRINNDLYSQASPDEKALSASNKRLLELSQALKALPSQSAGENKGAQRSAAELIQETWETYKADSNEVKAADKLNADMLDRAEAAFGEGN